MSGQRQPALSVYCNARAVNHSLTSGYSQSSRNVPAEYFRGMWSTYYYDPQKLSICNIMLMVCSNFVCVCGHVVPTFFLLQSI